MPITALVPILGVLIVGAVLLFRTDVLMRDAADSSWSPPRWLFKAAGLVMMIGSLLFGSVFLRKVTVLSPRLADVGGLVVLVLLVLWLTAAGARPASRRQPQENRIAKGAVVALYLAILGYIVWRLGEVFLHILAA